MKFSFLAMLCGWIACNIAWWVGMLLEVHFNEIRIKDDAMKVLFLGAATGIVILAAWLLIFLPVDLLIPDQSKLRRNWTAPILGFVAGSCVLIPLVWQQWEYSLLHHSQFEFHWHSLPLLLSPGITGMVAAYVRARDNKPSFMRTGPQPMNQ